MNLPTAPNSLLTRNRHVRVHHVDKDKDDPQLREVLSQRPEGPSRGRRRRGGTSWPSLPLLTSTPLVAPETHFEKDWAARRKLHYINTRKGSCWLFTQKIHMGHGYVLLVEYSNLALLWQVSWGCHMKWRVYDRSLGACGIPKESRARSQRRFLVLFIGWFERNFFEDLRELASTKTTIVDLSVGLMRCLHTFTILAFVFIPLLGHVVRSERKPSLIYTVWISFGHSWESYGCRGRAQWTLCWESITVVWTYFRLCAHLQ